MARFILGTLVFLIGFIRPAIAQTVTANFENLTIDPNSYRDGLTLTGSFTSGGATFLAPINTDFPEFPFGYGFAYSNVIDTTSPGFMNANAAFFTNTGPGAGAGGSANYAIGFQDFFKPDGAPTVQLAAGYRPMSVSLTNSTYAALSMRDGDSFAKKFGGASGTDEDWFKITITGTNSSNQSTGSFDFYLADFRFSNSAQDYIVKDWTTIDLSSLAADTTSLSFSLSSSDNGLFGMNTPAYFALDNLTMTPVPEPAFLGVIAALGAGVMVRRRRIRKNDEGRMSTHDERLN